MTKKALFFSENRPNYRANKIGRCFYPSSGKRASPAEAYKAKTRGNSAESEHAAGTAHDIRAAIDAGIFPFFRRVRPIPRTKKPNREKAGMQPTMPSPKTYWSAVK